MTKRHKAARFAALLALLLFCGLGIAYLIPVTGLASSDLSTGEENGLPPPRRYDVDPEMATTFARAAIGRLPGWRVLPARRSGRIQAEVIRPLGLAPDQVTVLVSPVGRNTLVRIRVRSRFGEGESVRHIRALQAEMDARLPAAQ